MSRNYYMEVIVVVRSMKAREFVYFQRYSMSLFFDFFHNNYFSDVKHKKLFCFIDNIQLAEWCKYDYSELLASFNQRQCL